MKDLIEGIYMVPVVKKINEPHSVVTIRLGSELFGCRVWPFTDSVAAMLELEQRPDLENVQDMDKLAIVVLLSDLAFEDIECIEDTEYNRVYKEIKKISLSGGH